MYVPFSNSVGKTFNILLVNFRVRDVRTISNSVGKPYSFSKLSCSQRTYHQQQCGANRIRSVKFRVRDVRTISNGVTNRILSVHFHEREVRTVQQYVMLLSIF